MPKFDVAHLREQGQDMIIVPLSKAFGNKSGSDQQSIIDDLQVRAASAGLKGAVVVVWEGAGDQMNFIAPTPWHPFFKSINLGIVAANINTQLSW